MLTGFIIGTAVVISAITGAFDQGQKNPEASNFFDSKNTIVEQPVYTVDVVDSQ